MKLQGRKSTVAGIATALGLAVAVAVAAPAQAAPKTKCLEERATIVRGKGNDRIAGTPAADVIVAGRGNDTIRGLRGEDRVCAGAGNDTVIGGQARDFLDGGPGTDTLIGGRGGDRMMGGPGNGDFLRGGREGDRLHGGPGDGDNVDGELGDDGAYGDDGNADRVVGGLGNDYVDGGGGDGDIMRGDSGRDGLVGGPGDHDVASFITASPDSIEPEYQGVYVAAGDGSTARGDGRDLLSGVEDLIGSPYADFLSVGANDRADGLGGNDSLRGGPGSAGYGGPGADSCEGFAHEDSCNDTALQGPGVQAHIDTSLDGGTTLTVSGSPGNDDVTVDGSGGGFIIRSRGGFASGPMSGCATSGGTARCTPSAPVGQIIVTANDGDDRVSIGPGVPASTQVRIDGGGGSDVLAGGPGNDTIDAGPTGFDTLLGGGGSDGLISGGEPDKVEGGAGPDLLVTSNACGGHVFDGGQGEDNVSFARDESGGVKARLGGKARASYNGGRPCLPSHILPSNESLEGSLGPDTLIGNAGSNRIMGQAGSDILRAKGGKDFILADDTEAEQEINCGGGNGDRARVDHHDPKPVSCR